MFFHRYLRSAFTIVELLVASTITILIVVMLGTMFGSLTGTSRRANQQIDAFRDARAALQMMERDMANLVRTQWRPDPSSIPPPPVTQPLTRPAAYLALKDLYADPGIGNQQFYALISAKQRSGDVCSVGYYCSWDGTAYTLRRFFRDSATTYAALSNPAPTPPSIPPGTPVYISETALYTPNPSPTPPASPDDILAQYVWNLKVTAYDAAGAQLTYPLVCDASATSPTAPSGTLPPAAIEISFLAMSPDAAKMVIAAQAGPSVWMGMNNNDPTYNRLIKPHVYEFRTRVKL